MNHSVDLEAEPDDAQACSENAMPSKQVNRTEEVKAAEACSGSSAARPGDRLAGPTTP